MGLIQDEKVVGPDDAPGQLAADHFAEMDERKQQTVVYDQDLSRVAPLLGPLVEAALDVAVFTGAT